MLFPGEPRLAGHSDGDAIAHAVIDALVGAAGLGDIGTHFPPGAEEWRDADSMELLAKVAELLREHSWQPLNVDATVVCERPRISPVAARMREVMAARAGLPVEAISIKGKSNEGLGWIGRGEGIAVHAVALVARSSAQRSGPMDL